jgi:hypothetical protein
VREFFNCAGYSMQVGLTGLPITKIKLSWGHWEPNSMRSLMSSAMTFVLSAHALLGCCWHHVHACGAEGAQSPAVCTVHQGHADEGPTDHDGHRHECSGPSCVFVRAEGPQINVILASFAANWIDTVADEQPGFHSAPWTALANPDEPARPVRLHLLQQVLLI